MVAEQTFRGFRGSGAKGLQAGDISLTSVSIRPIKTHFMGMLAVCCTCCVVATRSELILVAVVAPML